jgi:hypothetical protein
MSYRMNRAEFRRRCERTGALVALLVIFTFSSGSRAAERRAELLEPQLPTLTLRVPAPSAADGLGLRRNGVVLAASTWGSALPLDPGTYRIEASAPSRRPWVHELAIEPAAHITLDIPQLEDLFFARQSHTTLVLVLTRDP